MQRAARISILIPAYCSAGTIGACLEALRRQSVQEFEVIVINSSPERETEKLVTKAYPEVRFEQSPKRLLPHAARNRAVELARGELLVFTDPDCEADPEWLERLMAAVSQEHPFLAGAMEQRNRDWRETGVHLLKFHWLLGGLPAGVKQCAPTANAACTRELWERIGPFPGGYYASDGILSRRAARKGFAPWFVPQAVVRHHHPDSVTELLRQRFHRGRDYAHAQIEEMGFSGPGAWFRLLCSWLALPLVLFRAARDTFRCGRGKDFLLTLPLQLAGHALWALGESWGAVEMAAGNRRRGSNAR